MYYSYDGWLSDPNPLPCALSLSLGDVLADKANEFRHGPGMNFQQAVDPAAALGLFPELGHNHFRVQMVLVDEKVVRALGGHIPGASAVLGKSLRLKVTTV